MKLAVTYENGQIFQHFGHTEQFKIYEVADGKIVSEEVVDTNGSGHGALAGFLMQHGVEALICGGIGGGAQAALAEVGIKLYGGVSGEADAAVPLLHKAAEEADSRHLAALAVFIISMILLYAASTTYHTFNISEHVNKILRKIDHMMIFILIAGTYTPVCLIVLGNNAGYRLLALVWGIAIAGILVNALWINCPKWFSSLVYIAMGWICVLAFRQIVLALPKSAFLWLLTGGLIYTAGGIIYALKLPIFNAKHKNFGSHEIFHLFVMGGSLCHYVMMYAFVA